MSLKLRIYDPETKQLSKEYTTETVDIMFGTVEDIIDVIDIDNLEDNTTWLKLIAVSVKKLRPLLKEIFVGVTDEELKWTKLSELIPLFMDIFTFITSETNSLGGNSKN